MRYIGKTQNIEVSFYASNDRRNVFRLLIFTLLHDTVAGPVLICPHEYFNLLPPSTARRRAVKELSRGVCVAHLARDLGVSRQAICNRRAAASSAPSTKARRIRGRIRESGKGLITLQDLDGGNGLSRELGQGPSADGRKKARTFPNHRYLRPTSTLPKRHQAKCLPGKQAQHFPSPPAREIPA